MRRTSPPNATPSGRAAFSPSASTSTTASPAPRRDRRGLRQALAACRAGDELVVTKLDRLARSLPDARAIADELTAREVTLALGTSVHDPTDPYRAGEHTVSELEELFGVTRSTAYRAVRPPPTAPRALRTLP